MVHTAERRTGIIVGSLAEEMARQRIMLMSLFNSPTFTGDREHAVRHFAGMWIRFFGTEKDWEQLANGDFPWPPKNYAAYLEGDLWRQIRARVHKRDYRRCLRCPGRATEVHHLSYHPRVMRGEADDMLVSLCGPCHGAIERAGKLVDPEQQRREIMGAPPAPRTLRYPRTAPWSPSPAETNPLPE